MTKGKESKPHIGIYGRRNNGKSSLINRLAGQDISIVSEVAGTTTDPVKRSFEITGYGPVVLIDTAGFDDAGNLGEKRVQKTLESLRQIDLAILVALADSFGEPELDLIRRFREAGIPFFTVLGKTDVIATDPEASNRIVKETGAPVVCFSNLTSPDTDEILRLIRTTLPEATLRTPSLVGDIIRPGDTVLLITPIDVQAPEGRLILPQVQAIRDILDHDAVAVVVKEREVDAFLKRSGLQPALAITDSQVFVKADASIPRHIPLTSFSILLARYKGDFDQYLSGTPRISTLEDGDRILILESCSHHVSCDDIGRVKIPRWLSTFTGKNLDFKVVTGLDPLPSDLASYALVIQCGGCMLTRRQIHNRLQPAIQAGVAVTNYGMAIAWVQGIYHRAVGPFVQTEQNPQSYL